MALRPWLGAVLISFSGVWVRFADVEPARSAFLRGAYALPIIALLLLVRGRREHRRWWLPVAMVAGMLLGADLVAWHASIGIIGVGLATVLTNLQVVFIGLAGVVIFRERPDRTFWVALPLVLAGIWLLSAAGQPIVDDGSVPLGILFGVFAGLTWAGALIVLRLGRARQPRTSGLSMLWALTVGATIVMGGAATYEGVAAPAGWPADGWLLLLAIGSQVLAWLLLTSSIHRLPAAATSVALLLQPVLALVWGAVLLAEPIGLPQIAGAGIVLTGVAIAHRAVAVIPVRAAPPAPGGP